MKTIKKIKKVKDHKVEIKFPDEYENKQVEITAHIFEGDIPIEPIQNPEYNKNEKDKIDQSEPFSWVKEPAKYAKQLRKKAWGKDSSNE